MPSSSLAVSTPVALYVALVLFCLLALGASITLPLIIRKASFSWGPICSRHCGQHRDVNRYRRVFTQTLSCDANLLKINSPVMHNALIARSSPDTIGRVARA